MKFFRIITIVFKTYKKPCSNDFPTNFQFRIIWNWELFIAFVSSFSLESSNTKVKENYVETSTNSNDSVWEDMHYRKANLCVFWLQAIIIIIIIINNNMTVIWTCEMETTLVSCVALLNFRDGKIINDTHSRLP
jgi:hypothetical protein